MNAYITHGDASYTKRSGWLKGLHLEGAAYHSGNLQGNYRTFQDVFDAGSPQTQRAVFEGDAGDEGANGAQGAIGYALKLTDETHQDSEDKTITLIPMVGYGFDRQTYASDGLTQTFPDLGFTPGTGAEYETEWRGPFVGLALESFLGRNTTHFTLRGQYHFGNMTGQGEDRYISSLGVLTSNDFTQEADARGLVLNARAGHFITENLELFAMASMTRWSADGGTQLNRFSPGPLTGQLEFGLDDTEFRATDLMIGAALRW